MGTRETWQIITCQKRLFDLNSNGLGGFSGTTDLHEMDENDTLKNEQRYFGVNAPRKSYWYNFDPIGYLECATAGSFGGWEPGDETGRQFVPEPVALLLTVHGIFGLESVL